MHRSRAWACRIISPTGPACRIISATTHRWRASPSPRTPPGSSCWRSSWRSERESVMATNGNEPASPATNPVTINQQSLAKMLREAEAVPAPHELTHDMMMVVQQFSEQVRDLGRKLAGNGEDDGEDANAFANHIVKLFRDWANGMVARKRQELADLERFIGKVGK